MIIIVYGYTDTFFVPCTRKVDKNREKTGVQSVSEYKLILGKGVEKRFSLVFAFLEVNKKN